MSRPFPFVRKPPKDISSTANDELAASLDVQEIGLLELGPNWDGYGAPPLSPAFVRTVISELKNVLNGIDCLPPDVIPGSDGSALKQGVAPLIRIEVLYYGSSDGSRFLSVARAGVAQDVELFGADALRGLRSWAPQLTTARTEFLQVA